MNRGVVKFIEYIFAIVLILDGNSVYMTPTDMRSVYTLLCLIVLLAMSFLIIKKTNFDGIYISILISVFSLFYFILRPSSVLLGITLFVAGLPLFIFYFIYCYRRNHFYSLLIRIENLIIILSGFSLFLWIIGPTLKLIEPNVVFYGDWGAWTYSDKVEGYFGLLFETQQEDGAFLESSIWRNTSIFAEGPMYNIWLDLSITIELFVRKRANAIRLMLLCTSLFTVFSTTGFLYFVIIFSFYLVGGHSLKKIVRLKIFLYIVSACVLYGMFLLVDLLISNKSNTGSFIGRLSGYLAGWECFFKEPLLGIGFLKGEKYGFGFTNSLSDVLGQGGLWLFSILYYPFLRYAFFKRQYKNRVMSSLLITFVFLAVTTNFYTRFIFILFIGFSYSYNYATKKYDKEKSRCPDCYI